MSDIPTSIPTMMRALVTAGDGRPAIVKSIPVPQVSAGELLIKVSAVSQNPGDWMLAAKPSAGRVLGSDFAGTVVTISSQVQEFKLGDRVSGLVHGGQYEDRGSMAEYVVASSRLVWRIPDGKSFEEASMMNCVYVAFCEYQFLTDSTPGCGLPSRRFSTSPAWN
jgi:NADPH:quinone reductase-like Zn-dependent oxidoreductase